MAGDARFRRGGQRGQRVRDALKVKRAGRVANVLSLEVAPDVVTLTSHHAPASPPPPPPHPNRASLAIRGRGWGDLLRGMEGELTKSGDATRFATDGPAPRR